MGAWRDRACAFLFPVATDHWLGVLRIGLGLQIILYVLSLWNDWNYFFAANGDGLVIRTLSEAMLSAQSAFVPRLGWVIALGARVGLSESAVLTLCRWLLLCAGCGLVAGAFSHASAILAWFLHLCATKSGGFVSYGLDNFMTIGLFYLMLSPLPGRYALEQRWRQKPPAPDRHLLGFFRRVLQLHLCVIYFFSGLAKCLGTDWWNGANVWRALTRPPFNLIPVETLLAAKYLFPVAGIAICLLETSYAFFIWPRKTRAVWLSGIVAMHATIGLAMGMYLFALVMIVLNVAAFGPGFVWTIRDDVDLTEHSAA